MAEAYIALGGNLGDVRAPFDRAVAFLCDGVVVALAARSSDYRTPPWGVTDQPPFINAVMAVRTTLTAHELLTRGIACERALGRDRAHEQRWGPRTIYIDLLAYDDLVINDAQGLREISDGYKIRRAAVEASIACLTSLDTARALGEALTSRAGPPRSLQEYRTARATIAS